MITFDYAVIGLLAGFFAGYLGVGGGLIMVPALAWLFSRDSATAQYATHMAVATSLSTMMVTSLSSVFAHHRRRSVLWPVTVLLAPGLAFGAVVGALLAVQLSTRTLAAVFGGYALLAGIQLLRGREVRSQKIIPGKLVHAWTGLTIGMVSSLVGIGGGSMTVPWLLWHGRSVQQAVATASACGFPIALAGTITFIALGQQGAGIDSALGYVHLQAFAGMAIFSVLAAPLGAAAVHKSPPKLVQRLFGGFMLLVAWRMFF